MTETISPEWATLIKRALGMELDIAKSLRPVEQDYMADSGVLKPGWNVISGVIFAIRGEEGAVVFRAGNIYADYGIHSSRNITDGSQDVPHCEFIGQHCWFIGSYSTGEELAREFIQHDADQEWLKVRLMEMYREAFYK